MKALIIYYSRTDITKKVAELIKTKLNCDIERIEDVKTRKGKLGFIMSCREAVMKKTPKIKPMESNPENYDLIIIGTPVWANNIASPLRTYLTHNKEKIKDIAFFCTQRSSGADKAKESFESLMNKQSKSFLILSSKEVTEDNFNKKVGAFVLSLK